MAKMICGKSAHVHTESCKDNSGNYSCGKEEHTHGDSCMIGD